jgi:hypothetical protein
MRNRKLIVAALFSLVALPALAEPPDDVLDLVGARAPGAETQMQARGYVDAAGNNVWWNATTGVCVRVHVSQGHYKTIDTLSAVDCGMKALEESDKPLPNEPSKAAIDVCMDAADEYFQEDLGSSVMKSARRSGENWTLRMDTLGHASHCTVTQSGQLISMGR